MKILFNIALLLPLLVINSCSDKSSIEGEDSSGLVPVTFTNGVISKASGTTWEKDDEVGIYMLAAGTTTSYTYNGITYSNIQYYNSLESGASASFSIVDATETIYYPMDDSASDVVAIYPYNSAITSSNFLYPLNTEDQSDKPAIDLMIANMYGISTSLEPLGLNFIHSLSQISFEVKSGDGDPSLDGLSITVRGLKNSATYNVMTKEIAFADSTVATDLSVLDQEAIVIPQSADVVFHVATTDSPNGFDTESVEINLYAGKTTTVSLTLNRQDVKFNGESTIGAWDDSTEDLVVDAEQQAVSFTQTKTNSDDSASGTTLSSGYVGIFMFDEDSSDVVNDVANVKYSATSTGGFKVVDDDDTIYYPEGDVTVDFVAYYPHDDDKVGLDDYVYEVTATDQIDFLHSKLDDRVLSTEDLTFEFSHLMAKFAVEVSPGVGSPDLEGLTIEVDGLINTGTCDIRDDVPEIVLADNAVSTPLTIVAGEEYIIIPQSKQLTFTIKTDDNTTGFTTSAYNFSFDAGTIKSIKLVVNLSDVDFDGASTVTNWETITYPNDVNLY